jgi:hypothetical protein
VGQLNATTADEQADEDESGKEGETAHAATVATRA